ncbi:MAG: multicopper oxidase domain-containing protein [Rhizobiales bacterium]|nr:multicopper oxidase domain-containing protein [Hyphomicrobiales bacterium]
MIRQKLVIDRRSFLRSSSALGGLALAGLSPRSGLAAAPLLTVSTRTLEVLGKAATVYAVTGQSGRPGIFAEEGARFSGLLLNDTDVPLQMHWHGQVKAPFDQDRARPDGGMLAPRAMDAHDFELTPGTHWMHSHTLTEQQLLAAPMVAREKDAGDVQDVVLMLHDFAFRSPEEILAELGGTSVHGAGSGDGGHAGHAMGQHSGHGTGTHGGHAMGAGGGDHSGHGMGAGHGGHAGHGMGHAGHVMGMIHANDVAYDAFLANDRTLDDPEVVAVERGGRVRLRIINGATATSFFVSTPGLAARCVAVDGSPCRPLAAERFPIAQGQRLDLEVAIPAGGGAFPVLAQVEDSPRRTGIVLATTGASVTRITSEAESPSGFLGLELEEQLVAVRPLAQRKPDRVYDLLLGEEPGYRWTINGRVHGEHVPLEARSGERIEMTFENPTGMAHPMHLHGHHFQVVGLSGRSISGAMRDTVVVPPNASVTIAFDAGLPGAWFLHCHHLYHMATGMMTELHVT